MVGRVSDPATVQQALLHSYTTAFLWSSLIFVVGAVVAGLLLRPGGLSALMSESQTAKVVELGLEEPSRVHTCHVHVSCR
jgi:uncharacterized membrane protein